MVSIYNVYNGMNCIYTIIIIIILQSSDVHYGSIELTEIYKIAPLMVNKTSKNFLFSVCGSVYNILIRIFYFIQPFF